MQKQYLRSIATTVAAIAFITSCQDKDFDNYKIQSVDNHGKEINVISTAVTATSNAEFLANAVDASNTPADVQLIPVVLNTSSPAATDIHVTLVPALDTLASYNAANGTAYVMPGDPGTPAFTLKDNGIVTIKKGEFVGYLTVNTATADYFGATSYAYAYRIESVAETGYVISGNHNFGIVAIVPKNAFDGKYTCNVEIDGWDAYGIQDGVAADYGTIGLVTQTLTSNSIANYVVGGVGQPGFTSAGAATSFGATAPVFTIDSNNKVTDVTNSIPDDGRGRAFALNPAAPSTDNVYDPATRTIIANYLFKQNGRPDATVRMVLVYTGPRN